MNNQYENLLAWFKGLTTSSAENVMLSVLEDFSKTFSAEQTLEWAGRAQGIEIPKDLDVSGLPLEAIMAAFVTALKDRDDFSMAGFVWDLNQKDSIQSTVTTKGWFETAFPKPATNGQFGCQIGCHLEEVSEMLQEMDANDTDLNSKILLTKTLLSEIGDKLKTGTVDLEIPDPEAFHDALVDQIVTGTGVAHLAGFDFSEAVARVDWSNYTKYVNQVPQFKNGGKIAKGPFWAEADLKGLSGDTE